MKWSLISYFFLSIFPIILHSLFYILLFSSNSTDHIEWCKSRKGRKTIHTTHETTSTQFTVTIYQIERQEYRKGNRVKPDKRTKESGGTHQRVLSLVKDDDEVSSHDESKGGGGWRGRDDDYYVYERDYQHCPLC